MIDQVIALYQSGKTLSDVGRELGIPDTTISKMLHSAGVPTRHREGGADRARYLARSRPAKPAYLKACQFSDTWYQNQYIAFISAMRRAYPEYETPPGAYGRYPMPGASTAALRVPKLQDAPGQSKSSLEGGS